MAGFWFEVSKFYLDAVMMIFVLQQMASTFAHVCIIYLDGCQNFYILFSILAFPSKAVTNDKIRGQVETFHVVRISIWPVTVSQQCHF